MAMRRGRVLAEQLLPAVLALSNLTTYEEVHAGTADLLSSLIACDDLLWTEIDVIRSRAVASRGPNACPDERLASALAIRGLEHPAVASYLVPNDNGQPRRLSDITGQRAWTSSELYADAFREERAKFQLSLVISLDQGIGKGWVLTRSFQDFSDDDRDVASVALPCLVLLDKLARVRDTVPPDPDPASGVAFETRLTDREHQILNLLATGLKASAISHLLGISEATVRKHIEHIYVKFGAHDRLTVVLRAGSLGLLG